MEKNVLNRQFSMNENKKKEIDYFKQFQTPRFAGKTAFVETPLRLFFEFGNKNQKNKPVQMEEEIDHPSKDENSILMNQPKEEEFELDIHTREEDKINILMEEKEPKQKNIIDNIINDVNEKDISIEENLVINSIDLIEKESCLIEEEPEVIYPRRYTEKNISEGKAFFKNRFIKEKEQEKESKRRIIKSIKINDNINNTSINNNSEQQEKISVYSNNNNNINNQKKIFILHSQTIDLDKQNRINQRIFLQKVEKSIFSFNLKKYEESYNVLLLNGIIKSKPEYGEFLLVTSGFDKYILGEFLSKQKPPNNNNKIIHSFIHCCDFRNSPFLDALRFLLSRLNLPKDSNLILLIIDQFSKVYYNDNKESKIFNSVDTVYLLSSSVLALNTMFTRTDVKNMILMTKDQFISMNKKVSSVVLAKIYDELKRNKIDMKYDFHEIIYQRLSKLIEEKEKKDSGDINVKMRSTLLDSDIISDRPSVSCSVSDKIQTFGEEEYALLTKGENFCKFSLNTKPHMKKVYLSKDTNNIIWENIGSFQAFSSFHYIPVRDIKDITIGAASSAVLIAQSISIKDDNNYFTIHSTQRTLDLRADNEEIVFKWYKALKGLLNIINKEYEESLEIKKRKKSLKIKETIKEIWKREILYNWGVYREYINPFGKGFEEPKELVSKKNILDKLTENRKQLRSSKVQSKFLSRAEFLYLYNQGIPKEFRKKIWYIIIGNSCGIGENLFNSFLKKIDKNINLDEIEEKINQNNEVKFDFSIEYYISQMIIDIIKEKNKMFNVIMENKLNISDLMSNCFKIVCAFLQYRPDVIYNKSLVYIAMMLLLNGDDYYTCFVLLCNIICQTNFLNFLLKDQDYINSCLSFFEKMLKLKLPKIYTYLQKFEITPTLYFVKWYGTMFTSMFNYKTVIRIWDDFILKGERVIFEMALAVFMIQQDEFLNLCIADILNRLKRMPEKFKDRDVIYTMKGINLKEEYMQWKNENELAKEKCILFQYYLDEL